MDTRTTSSTAPSASTTSELDALIVATDILLDDALPTGVQDLLVARVRVECSRFCGQCFTKAIVSK